MCWLVIAECCRGLRQSVQEIEALAEFLVSLEVWRSLAGDGHLLAGTRVAADPLVAHTGRECAEAAQPGFACGLECSASLQL